MKKRFCLRLTALLLVFALGVTAFAGCDSKREEQPRTVPGEEKTTVGSVPAPEAQNAALEPFALAAAVYPAVVKYPERGDGADTAEIDAYFADQARRRENQGAGKELGAFFTRLIPGLLQGAGTENLVVSPLNLYFALSMLAEITDGSSRSQILDLLGSSDMETLRAQTGRVFLADYNDDGAAANVPADSIWLRSDDTYKYRQETLDRLAKDHFASVFRGTMGDPAYDAALQAWINEQTGGLLENLTEGLQMDPQTVIALASTLYFRDKWDDSFNEADNTKDVFRGAAGDTETTFMHRTQTWGPYYVGDTFAAAQINLCKEGSMMFLLPDEGVTPEEMLANDETLRFITTQNKHTDWKKQKSVQVIMSVPKFDVSSQLDLEDDLKRLGITDCFSDATADFSPLAENATGLYLSAAKHGVRVAIDEQGVTAAAYTVMMTAGAALPPEEKVEFTLDRPFAFVIYNNENLPLFVGIVNQAA